MWLNEMTEDDKRRYGFVKLTPTFMKQIGYKRQDQRGFKGKQAWVRECDACPREAVYDQIPFNEGNAEAFGRRNGSLCPGCFRENNRGFRLTPKDQERRRHVGS